MWIDIRPRVLIADDHQLVRLGLRQVLESSGRFVVVAETAQGTAIEALLAEYDPDVLILDLQLADGSAVERIATLHKGWPHLAILVLSMHDQRVYAERCLRLGAKGYLTKEEAAERILEAVAAVADGRTFVSPTFRTEGRSGLPIASLSDRELQVFELIGDGLPTRLVAQRLGVSEKTVETHKANIKKKLGIAHGSELVRLAMLWRESGGRRPDPT